MKLSHLEFATVDGLNLPGLLYEPDIKTDAVAILLHGNGSSSIFYDPNYGANYAKFLNEKNIAYFPFNNRGAHIIKKLNQNTNGEIVRRKFGCAFEIIKDCIMDIDGAIDHLKTLGFKTFYLIGASTGANKICVYNYYKPNNPISKYILLSGGDDSGNVYKKWGQDKFNEVLKICKEKIDTGKGRDLAPSDLMDIYSYQSIFDTLNPDGDYNTFPFYESLNNLKLSTKELFREFKSIDKPTLVIYSENDEFCYGRIPEIIELLKANSKNQSLMIFKIIPGGDHESSDKLEEIVGCMTSWL